MDSHVVILVLFICYLLISQNEVEGVHRNLSKEEDIELEKQLKFLNKPAVKTILTDYGEIYDCVDFYKQPAFDHPLLKDYKVDYQMKPTLTPKRIGDQASSNVKQLLGFKDGGCPVGTVPVKRITKEDLIRERHSSIVRPLIDDNKPGAHYAISRTKPSPNKYVGAGGQISIYNPSVSIIQYSAARIKVQNGPDSIEAGWRADPSLYGDNMTHFYIRLDAGEAHCFNTRCPGFIIVNSDMPLDGVFNNITQPGGPAHVLQLYLNRDLINGNWWLEVGPKNIQVGFWPKRIFTGLSDLATSAEWGGEVFSPPGTHAPAMGSGGFEIKGDTGHDGFIRQCTLLDGVKTVSADNVEPLADSIHYKVVDEGNVGGDFGHLVLYGGPAEGTHPPSRV